MTTPSPDFEFDADGLIKAMMGAVVKGLNYLREFPLDVPMEVNQSCIGIGTVMGNLAHLANVLINRSLLYGEKAAPFPAEEVAKFGMALGTLIQMLYEHASSVMPGKPLEMIFDDVQTEMRRQVEAAGFDLDDLPGAKIVGLTPLSGDGKGGRHKKAPKVKPSIDDAGKLDANQINQIPEIPDDLDTLFKQWESDE